MGHVTHQPAAITGHAVVRTFDGKTLVGKAIYDGRTVSGSMSLRVSETIGGTTIFSFRPPRRRTLALSVVKEIWWDDE
jgi:hypothetical protein